MKKRIIFICAILCIALIHSDERSQQTQFEIDNYQTTVATEFAGVPSCGDPVYGTESYAPMTLPDSQQMNCTYELRAQNITQRIVADIGFFCSPSCLHASSCLTNIYCFRGSVEIFAGSSTKAENQIRLVQCDAWLNTAFVSSSNVLTIHIISALKCRNGIDVHLQSADGICPPSQYDQMSGELISSPSCQHFDNDGYQTCFYQISSNSTYWKIIVLRFTHLTYGHLGSELEEMIVYNGAANTGEIIARPTSPATFIFPLSTISLRSTCNSFRLAASSGFHANYYFCPNITIQPIQPSIKFRFSSPADLYQGIGACDLYRISSPENTVILIEFSALNFTLSINAKLLLYDGVNANATIIFIVNSTTALQRAKFISTGNSMFVAIDGPVHFQGVFKALTIPCNNVSSYDPVSQTCLFYSNTRQTATEASQTCMQWNSYLITFHNRFDATAAIDFAMKAKGQTNESLTWIGLPVYSENAGKFNWLDRTTQTLKNRASNTDPAESQDNAVCVATDLRNESPVKWVPHPCDALLPFICAVDLLCSPKILTGGSGIITSPNISKPADHPLHCSSLVEIDEPFKIELRFQSLALNEDEYVLIIDGRMTAFYSHVIANLTQLAVAENALPKLLSSTNVLSLIFSSLKYSDMVGTFTATYTSVSITTPALCPPGLLTTSSGRISSPNYPYYYQIVTRCLYRIILPDDDARVRLTFDSFETTYCCGRLVLYDGPNVLSQVIAQLQGQNIVQKVYESTFNAMTAEFVTTAGVTSRGFTAGFESVK